MTCFWFKFHCIFLARINDWLPSREPVLTWPSDEQLNDADMPARKRFIQTVMYITWLDTTHYKNKHQINVSLVLGCDMALYVGSDQHTVVHESRPVTT